MTTWLRGHRERATVTSALDDGEIVMSLYEGYGPDGVEPRMVCAANGATVEQASANALNALMARQGAQA